MPTYAIRHRRDTTANWLAADPILLDGEMGYERTDDGRLLCKMGDGVCGADGTVTGTHWVDLPYCSGPAGPSPEFEWADTSIRFRNPDGTWGEWHDIRGERGLQGIQGVPGPIGESVPATRTTLGGVIIGPGLEVTAEGCLSVQPDGVTTQVNEAGLLSALGGNLLLNSELWITESGTFTAPVRGWYEVLLFGGGQSGGVSTTYMQVGGGDAGPIKRALVWLEAGEEVPVTVGAGGVSPAVNGSAIAGGATSFGDVTTAGEPTVRGMYSPTGMPTGTDFYKAIGAGPGGGYPAQPGPSDGKTQAQRNAACNAYGHFGGGGAASLQSGKTLYAMGAGAQGSVYARWHDPAKAAGPLPALFAARRMARAAAGPATVNLYDPETGQGSVWREEDAEAKLAEGMISEEAWLEICAARAAEARAAWLADPESEAERFALLRAARDEKLAATDYLVAPDYPLTDEQRAAVTVYRQSLRDVPAQDGAPWDGGGEGTPWPEEPAVTKVQEA